MNNPTSRRSGGPSQTDVVAEGIKDMILSGELRPGSRLPVEKDLAERLSVSRGPLREGVRALCTMGVLTTRQGDGTYVTSLDPGLLLAPMRFLVEMQGAAGDAHLQAVRRVLESEAAARAAVLIDEDMLTEATEILDEVGLLVAAGSSDHAAIMDGDIAFHGVIARACANPALEGMIRAFSSRTVRGRLWRAIAEEDAEQRTHNEHLAILAAVRRRDPDAARIRMAAHLLDVEEFLAHQSARIDDVSSASDPDRSTDAQ